MIRFKITAVPAADSEVYTVRVKHASNFASQSEQRHRHPQCPQRRVNGVGSHVEQRSQGMTTYTANFAERDLVLLPCSTDQGSTADCRPALLPLSGRTDESGPARSTADHADVLPDARHCNRSSISGGTYCLCRYDVDKQFLESRRSGIERQIGRAGASVGVFILPYDQHG